MRKAICYSKEIFLFADPTIRDSCHNLAAGSGNIRLFSLGVDTRRSTTGVSGAHGCDLPLWALEAVLPSPCMHCRDLLLHRTRVVSLANLSLLNIESVVTTQLSLFHALCSPASHSPNSVIQPVPVVCSQF